MPRAEPSSPSGLVFNVQRFSLHDGPGIRTTVFLQGCPADCWWCHNPEARGAVPGPPTAFEGCPLVSEPLTSGAAAQGSLTSVRLTPEAVAAEVGRDEIFYRHAGGGVTFSGGEPLAQPEFLIACLERVGALGLHRVVDTSGAASEATLLQVAEQTELFLYDLKLMDEVRHRRYVGISNGPVLDNLRSLARTDAEVWVRVPIIPGINDDSANLDALAEFVGALDRKYPIYLLPYHRIGADKYRRLGERYRLEGLEPPRADRLQEIADRLRGEQLEVRVGSFAGARGWASAQTTEA